MPLAQAIINKIIRQELLVDDLSDKQLGDFCELINTAYRAGEPIISDQDYDFVYLPALKQKLPKHPLLQAVEPEGAGFSTDKVLLPALMLSTDKAYSQVEVNKWLERIYKSANEINFDINAIELKATPKLDGFAGYDDGTCLYTRGDGKKGSDISRVFGRGLQVYKNAKRGQGAGEIVVRKSYFEKHLSMDFEYPRNFQASLIKEKSLDKKAKQAIKEKAALFVPFNQLPHWVGGIDSLRTQFDTIVEYVLSEVDFDVDGVVFEVINDELKTHMGANRKFHRWQIAFKENKDKAQVKVLSVTPQVGRTGKITPVAELVPTLLSGATINRASAHHYGLVKMQGLGMGSIIELTRSGLVIPKINKVLKPTKPSIPTLCPSCGERLQWESDFLMCVNHHECPAQVIGKMQYFFKILANNDGFGVATIKKLYVHGISKTSQIYTLTRSDLIKMGFGDKISENLIAERDKSTTQQIEDWRFLAAFGIVRLGVGNCENLLRSCALSDIFTLDLEKIANIGGFAELTAQVVVAGLQSIKAEFELLSQYGFNIEITPLQNTVAEFTHILIGKKIVFTGKMKNSRAEMNKHAKSIDIQVANSVSAKTDYLVIGKNVGQKKIEAAEKFDVKILQEIDYLQMVKYLTITQKTPDITT